MILVNLTLRAANEFVAKNHRHHKPVQGYKFAIGATVNGVLVAVAILGRPVSRNIDNGKTAEITRLCTDGTPNACSFLLSRAKRAAQALGFERVITYTLRNESGVSLSAAGYSALGKRGGGSWSRPSRARTTKHPTQSKIMWEAKSNV